MMWQWMRGACPARRACGALTAFASGAAALVVNAPALARSYRDAFDVSRGAFVTKASSTPKAFDPAGMLGGR